MAISPTVGDSELINSVEKPVQAELVSGLAQRLSGAYRLAEPTTTKPLLLN